MTEAAQKPPFWLVWEPEGYPPRFEHPTQQAAEEEAERLARQNPGKTFFVLCPTAQIRLAEFEVKRFAADDGIPF